MWKFNRGAIAFQVAGLLENSAVLPVAAMRVCGSWLEGRLDLREILPSFLLAIKVYRIAYSNFSVAKDFFLKIARNVGIICEVYANHYQSCSTVIRF